MTGYARQQATDEQEDRNFHVIILNISHLKGKTVLGSANFPFKGKPDAGEALPTDPFP
jgi:hypothetical protein